MEKKKYYTEAHKRASIKYAATHLKRVPLDMRIEEYNQLQEAAQESGETVNGYIKTAIRERMERKK